MYNILDALKCCISTLDNAYVYIHTSCFKMLYFWLKIVPGRMMLLYVFKSVTEFLNGFLICNMT
jgi:hypothetical protein